MFVPTNDDVAARATTLAKAAGKGEAMWTEHVEEARDALIAEHGPVEKVDAVETPAEPVVETTAEPVVEVPAAEPVVEVPATETPGQGELALKSDTVAEGNLEQVWLAKDKTPFAKKADAIAHNDGLAKAAVAEDVPETLTGALAALSADVKALNKADGEPVEEEAAPVEGEALDIRLGKYAAFLSSPDILAKGLYEVSRLADLMSSVGRLYLTVRTEAAKEGDGSVVPATIMTAVQALGESLITMATEEVGEVMERLREKADGGADVVVVADYCYPEQYIELAVSTMGLEKADVPEFFNKAVEISAKDKSRVQKIHDHAVSMGADCSGGDAAKLAKVDGLVVENDDLRKALEARTSEIAEALPLIKSLSADVATLKARPMPPVPRTHVVEKGADGGQLGGGAAISSPESLEEMMSKFTPDQLASAAIRVAQRNGRTFFASGPGTGSPT